MAFADEMMGYWKERYLLEPSDLLLLDSTIPTEAEHKAAVQKMRPLALGSYRRARGQNLRRKSCENYMGRMQILRHYLFGEKFSDGSEKTA